MVFVVSYAIASHSILFPNSPLRWSTTIDVIRKSYWNIYGELFLEEIEGDVVRPTCIYTVQRIFSVAKNFRILPLKKGAKTSAFIFMFLVPMNDKFLRFTLGAEGVVRITKL